MVLKDIRIEFNKKLVDARVTKISHISRIAEMKTRILDLHKMLSQPGEYPWPNLNEVVDVSLFTFVRFTYMKLLLKKNGSPICSKKF